MIAVADMRLRTLIDFTYRSHYKAGDGGRGGPNERRGKNGADLEIRLPVGTQILRCAQNDKQDNGRLIADLVHGGHRFVLAHGGRGGRGNAHFASATRHTPRFAEKGEPGQSLRLKLELKLLADVGVIGLPNVGKSSLIAHVSAARPKIADYPFTTLVPNLGVVRVEVGRSFVIADMPGLVEGAHLGAGLGHTFLKHVERTRIFIHVLDAAAPDRNLLEDFDLINRELALYHAELADRPQLAALNKMDLLPPEDRLLEAESALEEKGYQVFRISAVTGEGLKQLIGRASNLLASLPPVEEVLTAEEGMVELTERPLKVTKLAKNLYEVSGEEVERAVVMTDLDNREALRYLHQRLERMGVIRRLREIGAKDADRVRIGEIELEYVDEGRRYD